MKYQKGIELICIKTFKKKNGNIDSIPVFIKGKTYMIEDVYQKEVVPNVQSTVIELLNEQGETQSFSGGDKTKFFKIPRPEGVPITPPPSPKTRAEKLEERRLKKETEKEQEIQTKEWKKMKKLKVKDINKRIIRKRFD